MGILILIFGLPCNVSFELPFGISCNLQAGELDSFSHTTIISAIQGAPAGPAGFLTCGYKIENLRSEPLKLLLEIEAPEEWVPVSKQRQIIIPENAGRTIPFTVWIPAQASADSIHKIIMTAKTSPESNELMEVALDVEIRPQSGVELTSLTDRLEGESGREIQHLFQIRNTGNRTDSFHIDALSIPLCKTTLSQTKIRLLPGENRQIAVTITPPPTGRERSIHILKLNVNQEGAASSVEPIHIDTEVITIIHKSRRSPSRYKRLPLNMMLRMGATHKNQPLYGIRLDTKGYISPNAQIDMEVDFTTETRNPGLDSWKNQRFNLALINSSWEVDIGDVHQEFPDVVTRAISGRGIAFEAQGLKWTGRVFAGKERAPHLVPTWATGIEYSLASNVRFGLDYIRKGKEGHQYQKDNLTGITARFDPTAHLKLRYEAGFSRTQSNTGLSRGTSGRLNVDYHGDKLKIRSRTYYGTDSYSGWLYNRDGLALYSSYNISPFTKLWMNIDSSRGRSYLSKDSPESSTSRIRLGGRILKSSGPGLEITVGGISYRSEIYGNRSQTEHRDINLLATHTVRSVLVTAMWKWGLARNCLSGSSGTTNGVEFSLGGHILGCHVAIRLNDDQGLSTEIDRSMRTTSLSGDIGWSSWKAGVNASLMFASRWISSSLGVIDRQREDRIHPRINLRLKPQLWIGTDAALRGNDDSITIDRWQLKLTYSSSELLPVVWSPIRGSVRGVVFLDDDLDGYPDSDEERIEGVILLMEGNHRVTNRSGQFEWPALSPGIYWLDLNHSSLPAGYQLQQDLPIEVHVSAGGEARINIALTSGGGISGVVFLDDNHDGARDNDEEGIREIRMFLTQEGTLVAEWLTDHSGNYRIQDIPSGSYQIRLADNWLPPNWVITGQSVIDIDVTSDKCTYSPPYGIAPKLKRIVKTYQGGFKTRHLPSIERLAKEPVLKYEPEPLPEPKIEFMPEVVTKHVAELVLNDESSPENMPTDEDLSLYTDISQTIEKRQNQKKRIAKRKPQYTRKTPKHAHYLEVKKSPSTKKENEDRGPINLIEVYDTLLPIQKPSTELSWESNLLINLARMGVYFVDGRLNFYLP